MTEQEEKEKVAKVAEAARAFVRVWDEFEGDPVCVGEYLDALIDAVDATGDNEAPQLPSPNHHVLRQQSEQTAMLGY